ncbi:MAG: hypothetical protein LC721_08960 [Actinobacteria bacterium]|nr:hypothetical protein [Actinomycetota bacterium]
MTQRHQPVTRLPARQINAGAQTEHHHCPCASIHHRSAVAALIAALSVRK